ncbi:DUF7689 domain-containing protein [Anaerosalibacter sp. Marseille-P3206]|uniref:DUF7689 domain-containing protein n=1 Tax=Anaerosalibacter sp. Marseille-P3206 TaxID=1871005 RepID=UPI0009866C54|nr:hypothetical protein [Anaerosalibacter sp. Marseille-P3206]
MKKSIISILVFVIILTSFNFGSTVEGLYREKSYYDWVTKDGCNWYVVGPWDFSYNCLGYALDEPGGHPPTWDWPWGGANPTDDQMTEYLGYFGYEVYQGSYPDLITYDYPDDRSKVCHIAKRTAVDNIISKWGKLELIRNDDLDPFYPYGEYGRMRSMYKK